MGIIRAITQAIGGGLADQWLEVYEADDMGDNTVFTSGVLIRKGQNRKGTPDTVSNGSIIHVYDNQFMMLVDGGKIVDYTAEPGYYKVDNSSMPSMFNGEFGESLKETFNRFKFGGQTPTMQKVFLSICRRSKESNSVPEIRSIILIIFITQNCFCVHMELIPSKSPIRCSSMRKPSRKIRIMWRSHPSMNSICPSFRGTAGIYQPDVSGRDQNFLCDFKSKRTWKVYGEYAR